MCNREHWAKMLPIIQAFVNGETIEFLGNPCSSLSFSDPNVANYRIKPKQGWYRVAQLATGPVMICHQAIPEAEQNVAVRLDFTRWLTDRVYYDL